MSLKVCCLKYHLNKWTASCLNVPHCNIPIPPQVMTICFNSAKPLTTQNKKKDDAPTKKQGECKT